MDWLLWIAPGAGGAVGLYVLYVGATKGVPAAASLVKNWWSRGASDLASVKGDVAGLSSALSSDLAKIKTDVAAIRAKMGA
jgi:hypothetical protein